jgi:arabinofuranosyltransferase
MLLGTAWVGDDAFITLRVIDNFVNGYGLRFNVVERVQVFTHPLWLTLLTPIYALTREPLLTTMLASVALSLGALWLLVARIAKETEYGCLLVLAAAASQAIYQYSTSGLENPLTFLLLALFVWQFYRMGKNWISAGIIGLLLLNRLDFAVLMGPIAAYLFFRARGRERIGVVLAAILPVLLWIAFSLVYYGAPFPNTAYAKLGTGFGEDVLILQGLEYTKDFALNDPLLALIIGKAVFDAARAPDWPARLLGTGIVLYIAYIISIGGDFMSGRFFAAPGFLALCMIARMPTPQWLFKKFNMVGLVAVGLLGVLLVIRVTEQPMNDTMIPPSGIVDERRFYYSDTGLLPLLNGWVSTGIKPVPQWNQQQNKTPVVISYGAIGMLGYYSGPTVRVVDMVALADAFLARLPAIPGSRVGHYQRIMPPGYANTLGSASPYTDTEALRPLLNDVTLVTRAPILDKERWLAIWRLLSGQYHWVYEAHLYVMNKQ